MEVSPLGARNRRSKAKKVSETTTIRDFSGGWNVIDNDLNLDSKYAKTSQNIYRQQDGSIGIRAGTRWFADITSETDGNILDVTYFRSHIIAFLDNGEIVSVDGSGVVDLIWSDAIAALLPGTPDGWSTGLEFVSFTQFKGELIVCNGIDKPLLIDEGLVVNYLQDLAVGSNVNTPIGRYVTSVGSWVIIAGIEDEPGTIYISNTDTSGTWPGDTAPNDGTTKQVDSSVASGDRAIRGLAPFRNRLLVMFEDNVVVVVLGERNDTDDHIPRIDDTLPQFGSLSHRSWQGLGDDIFFADGVGVPSFVQSQLSDTLEPSRVSELIDPEIQTAMIPRSVAALRDRMFSVYHRLENLYMLFVPNGDTYAETTETLCFAYRYNKKLRVRAWAEFRGWNWRAACRSALGRVFFATDNRIFVMGDAKFSDEFYMDKKDDRDSTWTTATGYMVGDVVYVTADEQSYTCLENHTSGTFDDDLALEKWEEYNGEPVEFDYEVPWADFGKRMNVKEFRYASFDSSGNNPFTLDLYVDNFETEPDDPSTRTPVITLQFVGGTAAGFGGASPLYGGGRRARDERPWPMNIDYKILKVRLHGQTAAGSTGLKIIAISVAYNLRGILR